MSLTVTMSADDVICDYTQIVAIRCKCCDVKTLLINNPTIREAALNKGWLLSRIGWFCDKCAMTERYVPAHRLRSGWNHVYQTWNPPDGGYQHDYDSDDDYKNSETDGFEHDCDKCSKMTDLVETIENGVKLCFECYKDYEIENE